MLHIQSGSFANFIGAHYWNIADENSTAAEISEDSFDSMRHTVPIPVAASRAVYTEDWKPNLFLIESSLALGPSGFQGVGGMDPSEHAVHHSRVDIFRQETDLKHEYQAMLEQAELEPSLHRLDETVKYWADFWKAKSFPDCRAILPPSADLSHQYWWEESFPFEAGESDLRKALERIDSVRDITNILNVHGGFASYSNEIMEFISEELANKHVFTMVSTEGKPTEPELVNFARLFDIGAEFSGFVFSNASDLAHRFIRQHGHDRPITRFTSSAPLAVELHGLLDSRTTRALPVGLWAVDVEICDMKNVKEDRVGVSTDLRVPLPFPQHILRSAGAPDVADLSVNQSVKTRDETIRQTFLDIKSALKAFRVSGGVKGNDKVELDDWLAVEESFEAAAEDLDEY